ncbi:MAG TPA: hypothetical protein VHE57_07905 [Mycobacteriales bacterium]|nr:hypothetical protein [Mycobacteriales bacterium]
MSEAETGPPKRSETDPPAADRPVAESPGSPPPRVAEPADAAGRVANDPSVKEHGLVHEALQCAHGKPDGEVDTGTRGRPPARLFS